MSLFSDNIKYLRIKKGLSQEKFAEEVNIVRERYRKYDDGTSEPPYELLLKISNYHKVSIDILLSVDIRKIDIDSLLKLDGNRILLPITVDQQGNNFIEVVTHKAKAGYPLGYGDAVFIEGLPQMQVPNLGSGKHRAFPVDGDSMPPHDNHSYIIGRYIENLGEVKKGTTYILVTKDEGIVYKRIGEKGADMVIVKSDNEIYEPYEIKLSDILEIWEFAGSYTSKEAEPNDLGNINLKEALLGLRKEIRSFTTSNR